MGCPAQSHLPAKGEAAQEQPVGREECGQGKVCPCVCEEAAAGAGQPQMPGRAVGQRQAAGTRDSWGCKSGQGGQDLHADDTQIDDLSCPHSEGCFRVY